jgi:hypothetical protein
MKSFINQLCKASNANEKGVPDEKNPGYTAMKRMAEGLREGIPKRAIAFVVRDPI